MIQKFLHQYYHPDFRAGSMPKLLSVSFVPAQFNKQHPRILHQHTDAFELLLITSGEGFYFLDTTYFPIKKGDLVFCNSGVLHDEPSEKNIDLSFYGLRATGIKFRDLPDNHLIGNQVSPVISLGERYTSFESLFQELYRYAGAEYHLEEFCENLMSAIILLAISCVYDTSSAGVEKMEDLPGMNHERIGKQGGAERIYQIKKYIDWNYHDDLSLEYLGKVFSLSPYYLSHIFKKEFEIPPMQYLYRRRIGEAQSLLTTTTGSITEVASKVGFGDSNYFTIQFRKYVGMTPSDYRNNYACSISDK